MSGRLSRRILIIAIVLLALLGGAIGVLAYRTLERSRHPLLVLAPRSESLQFRFLDEGRLLAVTGSDLGWPLEIWSLDEERLLVTIEDPSRREPGRSESFLELDHIPPSGSVIPVGMNPSTKHRDTWFLLIDARQGGEIREIETGPSEDLNAVSPRGDVLGFLDLATAAVRVASLDGKTVRVLAPPPGAEVPRSLVTLVTISSNVALASVDRDGSSRIYSLHDGSIARVVSGSVVAFSDRDDLVVAKESAGGTVYSLVSAAGSVRELHCGNKSVNPFRCPQGSPVYVTWDNDASGCPVIEVRSLSSGELKRSVKVEGWSGAFEISSKGDRLALGKLDGQIEIWEIPP